MSVPYDRLGPGQSARWVYQVMGSGGPIPNPSGIRYLAAPPDGSGAVLPTHGPAPLSAAASAMQMANLGVSAATLGVSVANLGVSVWTLLEVRKQTAMLRGLQSDVAEIKAEIAKLMEKIERIDVNVAEIQLRSALQSIFVGATHEDGTIDLNALAKSLRNALDKFWKSMDDRHFGMAPGLLLAEDVRDSAAACLNVLWTARCAVLDAHRRNQRGQATRSLLFHEYSERAREISQAIGYMTAAHRSSLATADYISERLAETWKFQGSSGEYRKDARKHFAKQFRSEIETLSSGSEAAQLFDTVGTSHLQLDKKTSAAAQSVSLDYLHWWLGDSDAGLLWLLEKELATREDDRYWTELEGWEQPLANGEGGGLTLEIPREDVAVAR